MLLCRASKSSSLFSLRFLCFFISSHCGSSVGISALRIWKSDFAAKIWVFYCSTCTVDSSLPLTAKRSRRRHGTNGSKARSSGCDCWWSVSCYNSQIIQSTPVSLFDIFQANWTLLLFIRGASYFLTGQRSDERPGYRILWQCQLFLKAAGQAYIRRALWQGTIALIDGIYFEVGGGGRSSNIPENASWSQLPESTKNLGPWNWLGSCN